MTDSISKAIEYAETAVQEQIGKDEPHPSPQQQHTQYNLTLEAGSREGRTYLDLTLPQPEKRERKKEDCIIPIPKMAAQTRKPINEKSILYTISMTMMHPPATIKCLGEEKTICNLQMDNNVELPHETVDLQV